MCSFDTCVVVGGFNRRVRTIEIPSSSSAVPVLLLQLASFRANPQASRIRRFNQQRAVTLSGKHPGMTSADLYEAMRPKLDSMTVPDGFEVTIEGEIKDSQESNEKLFA